MITYINKQLAEDYSILLEEAATVIGCDAEELTTEKVVNNLSTLINKSPKFARLPIDEEVFEIDANARTIKVPSSFSKNGVGVVGDELAETVYFKIARYFDYADFGREDMQILIQWQAPNGKQGISKAIMIDKDSDPDYLFFGWAFNSNLTSASGSIKFNIRVLSKDTEGVLKYSYSTQQASVSIKASLVMEEGLEIEDLTDAIRERFMNEDLAPKAELNTEFPLEASDKETITLDIKELPSDVVAIITWFKDGKKIEGEHTTSLTIDGTGEYYATVLTSKMIVEQSGINQAGETVPVVYHSSVEKIETDKCKVLAPTVLTVVVAPITAYIIGKDKAIEVVVNAPESTKAEVTCEIYNKENKEAEFGEIPLTTITESTGVEEGIKFTYTPVANGYYKMVIVNSLNGSQEKAETEVIRVTEAPNKVTKPQVKVNGITAKAGNVGDELTVEFTETNGDSYQVNWYKEVANDVDDEEHSNEHTDVLVITSDKFVPEEAGLYFAKVITVLNGATSEESTMSKVISIIG